MRRGDPVFMPETLDYESASPVKRGRGLRLITLIGLLVVGVQLWLLSDFWLYRPLSSVFIYVASLLACFVPAVQRVIERLSKLLAAGSRGGTMFVTVLVALGAIAALYATALTSNRQFTPIFHDEFAYLLQAQMFASGHLWMPAHPMGNFFETFYVITDRAYAAQYFPGTALMLTPGALLGLPTWMMPLLLAGLTCAVIFLLLRELFDGAPALAGVVILIGVLGFRFVSITSISQVPAMLLASIVLFTLLRWDRAPSPRWMLVVGGALGWLAITRPLEGLIVGLAGSAFVAWRLRRDAWPAWRHVALAGLIPLLPFAMLQLVINHGVTGRWLQTPFDYYLERDMPGTQLGFHDFNPAARPMSSLPQKQAFFDLQVVKTLEHRTLLGTLKNWPRRHFYDATTELFPDMLLVIVVPGALLALRDARRWLVVAIMPLWWLAYTLHVFTFAHYVVFYASSMFVVVLSGFEGIASLLHSRGSRAVRPAQFVLPVVVSVMAMPQLKHDVRDQWFSNPVELTLENALTHLPRAERAIVMVRYDDSAIPEQEVVYNFQNAWPDAARTVRAHDLGVIRDAELYRYYAQRQPDRVVYRFDRLDLSLHRLGRVTDLALDPASSRPTIGSSPAMTATVPATSKVTSGELNP